jgi:hypothetical protein
MEKSYNAITVSEVVENTYKPDRDQAELRQVITKTYASGRSNNSLVSGLFDEADFGFEDGATHEETRVTWVDVPKGTTKEQMGALLAKNPTACIYKTLSSEPILSKEQKAAIEAGLTDLATIADRQRVCHGDTLADGTPNPEAGNPIIHKESGAEQYKCLYFWKEAKEDIDIRRTEPVEAEMTVEDIAQGSN